MVPSEVELLLQNEIKRKGQDVYFCLYADSGNYEITVAQINEKNKNQYVSKTNRRLFIKGTFYPLIFDLDMIFGITNEPGEILRQYSSGQYLKTTVRYSIHEGFFVKFKQDGEIIKSGYGIAEDKK